MQAEDVVADGFYDPSDMAGSLRGHLCLADTGNNRVVLMTDDFRTIHVFGRAGEGPGEFRGQLLCAFAERDDLVLVYDVGLRRLSRFSIATGDFLSSDSGWVGAPSWAALRSDGGALFVNSDWNKVIWRTPGHGTREVAFDPPCDVLEPPLPYTVMSLSPDGSRGSAIALEGCAGGRGYPLVLIDATGATARALVLPVRREVPPKWLAVTGVVATPRLTYVFHGDLHQVESLEAMSVDIVDHEGATRVAYLPRALGKLAAATSSGDLVIYDPMTDGLLLYSPDDLRSPQSGHSRR